MNKEKLKQILRRFQEREVWNDMEFGYIARQKDLEDILEALLEDNEKSV